MHNNTTYGDSYQQMVSARTDKLHIHTVPDYIVVDNMQYGVQQTRLTAHEFEDNFIRNLYKNIEELVKKVQN